MRGQGKERGGRRQGPDDPVQPIAGEDSLEKPERAPSFLSARELQAREPSKGEAQARAEERTERKSRSK